jgi:hypothetical protein
LEEQMTVGIQKTIGENPNSPHLVTISQEFQERRPVGAIGEDDLPGQAPVHDMVIGTWEFDA